jgi:YVTN family beta-propeller protein
MNKINVSRRRLLAMTTAFGVATVFGVPMASGHDGAEPVRQSVGDLPDGLAGHLFTANEHGSSISRIDFANGEVLTIPIPIAPHNVDLTPDRRLLLAVGEPSDGAHGHGDAHGNAAEGRLLVFDPLRIEDGPVAEIAVGDHPAHVVASVDSRFAFVTNAGDDTVSIVDLENGSTVASVATGRYPHGLRLSPDGSELYVANVLDGSVSVIDVQARRESARIAVGKAPVQVGFLPDGKRAYVSLRDEDSLAVVDTAKREVVAMIGVGRGPIQVHATPDGSLVYAANEGSRDNPSDTVSVIDVATQTVIDTIRTGPGAHGVSVSEDGDWVFVTNIVAGTVSILDRRRGTVRADISVGRGPNGIAYCALLT